MRTPEEEARAVFGARAALYATSAAHTDPQVLARVVALAAPRPDWRILDLATGTGHTAFALAPHCARIVGTDLTGAMLAEARRLQSANGLLRVAWLAADVHRLPLGPGLFHAVTCRRAAHHFSALGRALGEMRRVLRPGGRLVIDDRSVPEDDFVDACMNRLDRWHDGSHVRQYRPGEWAGMLERAGFEVEVVEPYVKHRPITSLTDGVPAENVRKIHETLAGLDARQRGVFNLQTRDGRLHLNHWYVLLAARRP